MLKFFVLSNNAAMARILLSTKTTLRLGPSSANLHASFRGLSNEPQKKKDSSFLGPNAAQASPEFKSRWLMFLPAFGTHMCLGAPFGWSAVSATLTREAGFGEEDSRRCLV